MIRRILNFLVELYGLKNLCLMFSATFLFAFLEVFGLGFFIIIILEILKPEVGLCSNPTSVYSKILTLISFCTENNIKKILILVITIFIIKLILQTLITVYKSRFLSHGKYQFIQFNILRIIKIKIDELEKQDFFQDNNSLIKEADILFTSFFNKFFECIIEILIFSILLLSLIYLNIKNIILILFLFPFCFFYFFSFSRKTKDSGMNRQKSLTNLNQKFYNIFKNKRNIENISTEKFVIQSFIKYLKIYKNSTFYHLVIIYLPRIILENFLFIVISFVVILSINITNKEEVLSFFTIYALVLLRLLPSLNRIKNSIDTLFFRSNCFNLVYEINNKYKYLSNESDNNTIEVILEKNLFKIKKLNISADKKIFINAEILIEKNKYHCIKGPSGSGKSTILNFLCGFKKAETFVLDNSEEYKLKYLKIYNSSYLSQKIFFEDTTLVENLLMGEENNEINKNKLIRMMKELNLDNFINKLEKKVTFDGNNFSLGEQQRFLIIRSMLKKPDILVLDEPFSALDLTNQNILINYLIKYKGKITLIMSTHVNFSKKLFDYHYEITQNNFLRTM